MSRFKLIAGAALATLAVGVPIASAVPVFVTGTSQTGPTLYVNFSYRTPATEAYTPNFKAAIFTSGDLRLVRSLGRHNDSGSTTRGKIYSNYFYFNGITSLRPGRYLACVRGSATLDSRAVSTHTSCRAFTLR